MTRLIIKGVKKLNPTKAIMKTYHSAFIKATTEDVPGYKRNGTAAEAVKSLKGKQK